MAFNRETITAYTDSGRTYGHDFPFETHPSSNVSLVVARKSNGIASPPSSTHNFQCSRLPRRPQHSPFNDVASSPPILQPPRLHHPQPVRTNFPTAEENFQKPDRPGMSTTQNVLLSAALGFAEGAVSGYQARQQYLYTTSLLGIVPGKASRSGSTKIAASKQTTTKASADSALAPKDAEDGGTSKETSCESKDDPPSGNGSENQSNGTEEVWSRPGESQTFGSGELVQAPEVVSLTSANNGNENARKTMLSINEDLRLQPDSSGAQPVASPTATIVTTSTREQNILEAQKTPLEGNFEVRISERGGSIASGATERVMTQDGDIIERDLGMQWFGQRRSTNRVVVGTVEEMINGSPRGEAGLLLDVRKLGDGYGSLWEFRNTHTGKTVTVDHGPGLGGPMGGTYWAKDTFFQDDPSLALATTGPNARDVHLKVRKNKPTMVSYDAGDYQEYK